VAVAGITGEPFDLTAAYSVLARALSEGREILILTRSEIEKLAYTDELVQLLERKRAQLAVFGHNITCTTMVESGSAGPGSGRPR